MERSAHVTSIDAVRDFRAALAQFGGDAKEAIVMLMLEARKGIHWLQHDRMQYWPDQVRKAQDHVVQARNELERCQLRFGSEDSPSCFDQKKALEKAKRRLRLCEEKVKAVKKWVSAIREELEEFDGEIAKMTNWLESDVPRGLAALERMLHALEKYAGDYHNLEGTVPANPTATSNNAQIAPPRQATGSPEATDLP